jgi:hypothetical protein
VLILLDNAAIFGVAGLIWVYVLCYCTYTSGGGLKLRTGEDLIGQLVGACTGALLGIRSIVWSSSLMAGMMGNLGRAGGLRVVVGMENESFP